MKTGRSRAEVVFKDMNTANVPARQALKKPAPAIKTEAFGDKENALEKTELMKSKVVEPPVSETKDVVKRTTTHIECIGERKIHENTSCENKIQITADDLTNPAGPSDNFYKLLAEQRRAALEQTLVENKMLHDRCEVLEAENDTLKRALQEATEVINVLNEIVAEDKEADEKDCESQSEDTTCVKNSPAKQKPKNAEDAFGNDSTVYDSDDSDRE